MIKFDFVSETTSLRVCRNECGSVPDPIMALTCTLDGAMFLTVSANIPIVHITLKDCWDTTTVGIFSIAAADKHKNFRRLVFTDFLHLIDLNMRVIRKKSTYLRMILKKEFKFVFTAIICDPIYRVISWKIE